MERGNIALERPERFEKPYTISREKLIKAASDAADRLEIMAKNHNLDFPGCWSVNYKYEWAHNRNWVDGMYAGCYWRAWEITGNKFFKDMAEKLTATFRERLDKRIGVDDHDVGFAYSPSCVAAYKLTGDEAARKCALDAAEYFLGTGYSPEGKFIIRDWKYWKLHGDKASCRTMMDSLMNVSLFFWAYGETGNKDYYDAGVAHVKTTADYLIRKDGSSYHHYQFDPVTAAPMHGVTLQGHSNESCWSRGHAWGVYGFPSAYIYAKEDYLPNVHRDVTYFMLNHLPSDLIPAWDYDFTNDNAIKDSSASVISVCGMLEAAKVFPNAEKTVFESASAQMMEAVIDKCTGELGVDGYEGLIFHVTAALPQKLGVDGTAVYGDYFYLEALDRYINPDKFTMYW